MKKAAVWTACLVLGFAALALVLDGLAAVAQPRLDAPAEGVLHTLDAEGMPHETRLAVVRDEEGRLWVSSNHYFRGWYERVLANPQVEFDYAGALRPFTAVPIDTPESEALVKRLLQERTGVVGFWMIRTFLLFADMKPVRLDPRQPDPR